MGTRGSGWTKTARGILIGILAIAVSALLCCVTLTYGTYLALSVWGIPYRLNFLSVLLEMGGLGLVAGGIIGILWTRTLLRSSSDNGHRPGGTISEN